MSVAVVESELLFLNAEDGMYELEGQIGSIALPTNLSESLRLRLASVAERDAPLHLLGTSSRPALTPPLCIDFTRAGIERVSLPPCRLCGAAVRRAPPLGPGVRLTLPCGWNNAGSSKLQVRASGSR